MTYRELYQSWLDDPYFDEETKKELKKYLKFYFILTISITSDILL